MTYSGFIVVYDDAEKQVKKWRYWNKERRKKLLELIKRDWQLPGHYYHIIPYVYVYPNNIKPINV